MAQPAEPACGPQRSPFPASALSPDDHKDAEILALRRQLAEVQGCLTHFQQAQQRCQAIVSACPDAIVFFDRESRLVLEANPKALELYGYSLPQLRQLSVDCLEAQPVQAGPFSGGYAGRRLHQRSNGARFPVQVTQGEQLWNHRLQGYLICQDLTRLQELEHEGDKARSHWEATFDSFPDAITLHDQSHRLLRANQAACTQFGLSVGAGCATSCASCFQHSFCPPESCLGQEAARRRCAVKVQAFLPHTGRHYEFNVIPHFDARGELHSTTRVVRDVTAYRLLEEQLLHSQKMESLGTLAGGVAHDFNNILTVILGTCALLQLKMGEQGENHREIAMVMDAAERAAALTRNLLTFSRKQIVNSHQVDVAAVVRRMEDFFRRLIGEHIQLVISCAKGSFNVRGDLSQLEQVFMNLAVNAKDAMPEGGMLIIYLAPVQIDDRQAQAMDCAPGSYLGITISDTGCGMDQATRERIFDPFFTTKAKGKGAGLGLSTVYGIVKQHGGVIKTSSELGKGTNFRIFLPLCDGAATARPSEPDRLRTGSGTILLAEDEAAVRITTSTILEQCGYEVIPAVDGEDAVARFAARAEEIDLVILDVIMPRLNGMKACEAIRALKPQVRVLFTSGYTDALIDENGIIEGEFHFLPKPASLLELSSKVRELMDDTAGAAPAP
jgi:signal transduction histidine kinase/CheY-like chemotaxis protein